MRLKEWMEQVGMQEGVFAALLNVDQSTVNRWKSGTRIPRPRQMAAIERVTEGAVCPSDFITPTL